MRRSATATIGVLAALLLAGFPGAASAATLDLGFSDTIFDGDALTAQPWFARAHDEGASWVRISLRWSDVEPAQPAHPTDPADPAYNFAGTDALVRAATASGERVLLTVTNAPRWAQPSTVPAGQVGTYRPDAKAFGAFAQALGRRYGGAYDDPAAPGGVLPAVDAMQPWNEPNLSIYLTPQYTAGRAVSPVLYRALLNAFQRGVRAGGSRALVVAAATAPFGDYPEGRGQRMPPALFVRTLLCLSGTLARTSCPDPARFDVLDHHPYSVGSPARAALNIDDVTQPDMDKLQRPLRRAVQLGLVVPRTAKPLWATELSWDSSPPDPQGISETQQATWLARALRILYRQGIHTVLWFQIRDQDKGAGYDSTYQSGTYFRDGRAKRSATAFRFPLVVTGTGAHVKVWGRAPAAGTVTVQRRAGSTWRTLITLRGRTGGVFERRIRVARGTAVRAVADGVTSLAANAP